MKAANVFDQFDELMAKNLADGETVLWKGRPAAIKVMEAPYGIAYMIRWVICLALIIGVLWYQLVYVPARSISISWAFPVIFILLILYCALRPLIDIYTIKQKCVYCITNHRAIVAVMDTTLKIKAKNYKDIDAITADMIADRRGIIYIGKKQKQSFRRSRLGLLVFPVNSDDEGFNAQPLIFYNVENPHEIMTFFPILE